MIRSNRIKILLKSDLPLPAYRAVRTAAEYIHRVTMHVHADGESRLRMAVQPFHLDGIGWVQYEMGAWCSWKSSPVHSGRQPCDLLSCRHVPEANGEV